MALLWLGTNQRRSMWEWLTEIPGDVIVCTIGWPGGNSASFYEMHPDLKIDSLNSYHTDHIRLTHFSNGQPMIPHRVILQWYCYWLHNTQDETVQAMAENLKQHLIQDQHASYVLDCSDWNHLDQQWVRVIQQVLSKDSLFRTSGQKIYLYLPHVAMVKILDESNIGGKIHT